MASTVFKPVSVATKTAKYMTKLLQLSEVHILCMLMNILCVVVINNLEELGLLW